MSDDLIGDKSHEELKILVKDRRTSTITIKSTEQHNTTTEQRCGVLAFCGTPTLTLALKIWNQTPGKNQIPTAILRLIV